MRIHRAAMLTLGLLGSSAACYHATVETGATPSTKTIDQPFAAAFIGGIVPPATVETAQRCPNGIAKVETQLSFLNWLVGALTFSIFTPMSITVTCATGGSGGADASTVHVPAKADSATVRQAVEQAAKQSADGQHEVYVVFQ